MKKKKGTKSPTNIVPDFHLWQKVGNSIDPKRTIPTSSKSERTTPKTRSIVAGPAPPPSSTETGDKKSGRSFSGINRRQQQRLLRGQLEPQARIDLHGHTVAQAQITLASFLTRSRQQGLQTVLVITGKGFTGPSRHVLHGRDVFDHGEGSGKIRQAFIRWMEDNEYAHLVTGVQPAHPRHGGGGAFYVRLKSATRSGK